LIELNRQEAMAVLLLSGTLLVGTAVAVLDHFDAEQFEDFHVISGAVAVPRLGEPTGADPASPSGFGPASGPELLSINKADAGRLQSLPKIGPKTVAAIVEYRQVHGPFGSVDDLRQVRGIGVATIERLRMLVSTD